MYNILLVDDEPIIKVAIRKLLNNLSVDNTYELASTASNGREALKIISQKEIDIIITDLKMPQMDGIELIRELSKNSFDGVVLVLSNYTDFELVREALTAGALDYIIKVNLDSAILQQQLAKAANKLDSLRQNKKQEIEKGRLIEKSKRIMQNDQMMKLFNNPDLTQNDLEILDNITTCEKDCLIWIIDVYLKPGSNEKKLVNLPMDGIIDLLQAIFEQIDVTVLPMSYEEILCLIPLPKSEHSYELIENKIEQITRQFQMYFDLQTISIVPHSSNNLKEAYAQYQLCLSKTEILFYGANHTIVRPELIEFSPLPDNISSGIIAQQVLELHANNNEESMGNYISELFNNCKNSLIKPTEVKILMYQTIEEIYNMNIDSKRLNINNSSSDINNVRNAILECQSVIGLREIMLEAISHINDLLLSPEQLKYKKEIQNAIVYLHGHYPEKITLEGISKSVNLNPSYLCRLFKKETGESIFQHLLRIRMEHAIVIMQNKDCLIKEIAATVGIDDQFYFTKTFKKIYGISPSDYMSKIKQQVEPHIP